MLRVNTQQLGDFSYLLKEVRDFNPLLNAWAAYRRSQFQQQIALRQDPYGQEYSPLTVAYLRQKRKKWGNRPILRASGRMVRSHTVKVVKGRVEESIEAPAQYHQRGNSRMVKRALLYDGRGMPAPAQEKLLTLAMKRLKK